MKRYVIGFLFDVGMEHVVLIRKIKPEWQKDRWNGLGGHIEPGEDPMSAMVREFHEEAGLLVHEWEQFAYLTGVVGNADQGKFELFCFRASTQDMWSVKLGETEEGYVAIHRTDDIPGTALPNVNWLIPMAMHSTKSNGMPFRIEEAVANEVYRER